MTSTRIGCFGLVLGGLLGFLLVVIFFVFWGQQAITPLTDQTTTPAADVTLFLSERTLSRLATDSLQQSVAIDVEPGGQLEVTMPIELFGLEPVVRLGISLDRQQERVVSHLHWAKLGFIRIPADRLSPQTVAATTLLGTTITERIPPEFTLVGLTTTTDGLNFQLDWTQPGIR